MKQLIWFILFIPILTFGQIGNSRIGISSTIGTGRVGIENAGESTYDVNFIIYQINDGDTLLCPYAKISIDDDYEVTDSTGAITLNSAGSKSYSIRRAGYETVTESIEITADITIYDTIEKYIFDDYYLPSYVEIANIVTIKDSLFVAFTNEKFWSSSENSATYGKRYNVSTNTGANDLKTLTLRYRPIRDFQSDDYTVGKLTIAGGNVFYIDATATPDKCYEVFGYNYPYIVWSNINNVAVATTSINLGEGQNNTNEIIAQAGHTSSAAYSCDTLNYKPYYMEYNNSAPLFSIVFDDGVDDLYTDWYPLLEGLSVNGCAAIVTDWVGDAGRVTYAQLLEMQTAGWEILSHSKTHWSLTGEHGDPTPTEADIFNELSLSRTSLDSAGLMVNNFAYAYGDDNFYTHRYVSLYYRSARDYAELTTSDSLREVNEEPFDMMKVRSTPCDIRRDFTTEVGMDEVKAFVDQAYEKNWWMTITLHDYDAAKGTALTELVNYVKTKGIQIVTINEALDLIQ